MGIYLWILIVSPTATQFGFQNRINVEKKSIN